MCPLESRSRAPRSPPRPPSAFPTERGVNRRRTLHLHGLHGVHLYLTRFPPLVHDRSVGTHEVDGGGYSKGFRLYARV